MSNPTHGTCNENYGQVFLAHELGNISTVRAASRRSCNHLSLRLVKMQGACATADMGSNAVGSRVIASSPSDCDSLRAEEGATATDAVADEWAELLAEEGQDAVGSGEGSAVYLAYVNLCVLALRPT